MMEKKTTLKNTSEQHVIRPFEILGVHIVRSDRFSATRISGLIYLSSS